MSRPENLCFLPATELAIRIRRREVSPVEVVDRFLERIDERNPELNAYVTVLPERAREAARAAERALESGEPIGPLHGVPVAIKDLSAFKNGVRHTFGSVPFADFVPEDDAVMVERLEAAGAVVLGKTNTPEFGHKGTTANRLFGRTANPFASEKTAGGSSGGSAAAVADGLAALAQGSDAAGSLRIPASACGVFGFKPSAGRVPHAARPNAFGGHTPFVDYGPLARTVDDAALMLSVVAGPHSRDPFSLPDDGTDFAAATRTPIADAAVAFSPDLALWAVDPTVREIAEDATEAFETAGATVERSDPSIGHDWEALRDSFATGLQVGFAALVEDLRERGTDLDERREEISDVLVGRLETGREYSAVEYIRANNVRTDLFDAVQDLFDRYDLLVTPTIAVPPFDDGDGEWPFPTEVDGRKIDPHLGWVLTWPFNMTGHPAASVPAGFTEDGLPVGLQVVGRRFADDAVLAACAAFERVRPWYDAYPPDG